MEKRLQQVFENLNQEIETLEAHARRIEALLPMPAPVSMFVKPSESNSEWLTRKRLIDPKLKAAGWKVVPFSTGKL